MPLQAKHIVEEINGTRCSVVEKGATAQRVAFLKDLLEFNRFEVMVVEENRESEEAPLTYIIGVTDTVFHATIAVYEMALKTRDGRNVSPEYWDQKSGSSIDQYWLTEQETKPGGSAWYYAE